MATTTRTLQGGDNMNEPSYVIDTLGIEEEIRCAICKNQIKTDRGCDGNCKYDENLFRRITDLLDNRIGLLPIYPEPHEIGYDDCSNALLKMWMDNVLTDGEYYRIADKLNEKWGKTVLPEPYEGVNA